jgi:hypothetical protein
MGTQSVLIIEDDYFAYQKVNSFLTEHHIDVFPKENEFKDFRLALRDCAVKADILSFDRIKGKILDFGIDFKFIILDKNLKGKKDDSDRTGDFIYDSFLKNQFPETSVLYYSKYEGQSDQSIHKSNDLEELQNSLYKLIIQPLEEIQEVIPNKSKSDDELIKRTTAKLKIHKWLSDKDIYKINPLAFFLIDKTIKYSFYIGILAMFIYAWVFLTYKILEPLRKAQSIEPLQLAEYSFIAFLPFLIACGFYVFYRKSLSPYFLTDKIATDDFSSSSELLSVTKKLFISSLLSYLFIKLIELIVPDKPNLSEKIFNETYSSTNPFIQICFISSFILILILYQIYIEGYHTHRDHHNQSNSNSKT